MFKNEIKQNQLIHEDEHNPGRLSHRADVSGKDAKEVAVEHKLGLQTLSSPDGNIQPQYSPLTRWLGHITF